MKRLYLRPEFRGKGLGRRTRRANHRGGSQIGYRRMRLDTVEPVMKDAVGVYRKAGVLRDCPLPHEPDAGTLYMEIEL